MTVYTIGHSTRSVEDFIEILGKYKITEVVDIRTIPKSRHNPQFNSESLEKSLKKHKLEYIHMELLGGLRHTTKDSINKAWKNASFRGFADYMQTPDFEKGIKMLIELANKKSVVIMCAEAVPWRCHRSLIGDALLARKIEVVDIYSEKEAKKHEMTPWAKVNGVNITYPSTV